MYQLQGVSGHRLKLDHIAVAQVSLRWETWVTGGPRRAARRWDVLVDRLQDLPEAAGNATHVGESCDCLKRAVLGRELCGVVVDQWSIRKGRSIASERFRLLKGPGSVQSSQLQVGSFKGALSRSPVMRLVNPSRGLTSLVDAVNPKGAIPKRRPLAALCL